MKKIHGLKHKMKWSVFLFAGLFPLVPHQAFAYTDLNEGPGPVIDNPGYKRIQHDDPETIDEAWVNFNNDWSDFLNMFIALGLLSSVGIFIYLMIQLAGSASNPYEREKVQKDILVLLVVTACLGGIGTLSAILIQTAMG